MNAESAVEMEQKKTLIAMVSVLLKEVIQIFQAMMNAEFVEEIAVHAQVNLMDVNYL